MTYRYVPMRWRLVAQLATLAATALVGLSIALTPPLHDPKLTIIERAMSAHIPAYLLIVFGFVGLACEGYMAGSGRNDSWLYSVVTTCHTVLFGLMMAYSISATVGLVRQGLWYNFGAPVIGILVSLLHAMYIQRKRHFPAEMVERAIADGRR